MERAPIKPICLKDIMDMKEVIHGTGYRTYLAMNKTHVITQAKFPKDPGSTQACDSNLCWDLCSVME